jgi:sigma-E factor negative regulatory protein RseA
MNDSSNEKLSAFMDDEHHPDVIELLKQDSEARGRWSRYHLIRDVLSGHTETLPPSNFVDRVSQALRDEPTILRPVRRGLTHTVKQIGGLAIAATVATVAVLTIQQSDVNNGTAPTQVASASTDPVAVHNVSNPLRSAPMDSAAQTKLSSYLVNHNEYSVSSRMQGMLPYTRIVSVTPNERVVVRADDK